MPAPLLVSRKRELAEHALVIALARRLDDVQSLDGKQAVLHGAYRRVHVLGSEAPAHDEQDERVIGHAEGLSRFVTGACLERGAYGIAEDDRIACAVESLGALGIGERDCRRVLGKIGVCHAGNGVLLVDDERDVHLEGRTAHRNGHVGPEGDDGIRAPGREEPSGRARRLEQLGTRGQEGEGMRLVETAHREALELETRLCGEP